VTLRADRARRKGDGRNNRLTRRAAESGLAVVVSARRVRAAGLSLDWRAMQVLRPVSKYYAVREDLATGKPSTSGCAVIQDLSGSGPQRRAVVACFYKWTQEGKR